MRSFTFISPYIHMRLAIQEFTSKYHFVFFQFLVLFFASNVQAQVYKWTDSNGQIHYADSPQAAGKVKPQELKIAEKESKPSSKAPSDNLSLKEQEEKYRAEKIQRELKEKQGNTLATQKPSAPFTHNGSAETDSNRCALARAIKSGQAKPASGRKVDDYDRSTAEQDIKTFCH